MPNANAVFGAGGVDEPTMSLKHSLLKRIAARRIKLEQTLGRGLCRWHLCVLIPILSLYFALAFYHLNHQSFWTDEVISVIRATSDEPLLSRGRWFSGQSPPYFILLHLWAQQGTGEFTLRVLSVLLGGITVYLTYILGFQLCNLRVAMFAAMLLATSPFLIWYSQEVRYVILTIPIGLVTLYAFKRVLHAQSLGWWLLYCGSVILAIATFVVSVFLPLAQGLYLVCSPSRRLVVRKWAVCQLAVVAFFLWWANDGHIGQLGGYWQKLFAHVTASSGGTYESQTTEPFSAGGSREFTLMALPYTFFAFSAGFSLGPSLPELHASRALATLLPHAGIVALSALLFGGLFILGLASLWRQSDSAALLVLWLVIPVAGALGVSALIPELAYNVRYAAVAFPVYILILSAGVAGLRRPIVQHTMLAAVLVFNGLSLANYYHNPRYSREDARGAARYLQMATGPRDVIGIVGNTTALQYYYGGTLPIVTWDETVLNDPRALSECLQKLGEDHEHLWLVAVRPWEVDPIGRVKSALDEEYSLVQRQQFPGVDIAAYHLAP